MSWEDMWQHAAGQHVVARHERITGCSVAPPERLDMRPAAVVRAQGREHDRREGGGRGRVDARAADTAPAPAGKAGT